ncbi:MAG: phosphoglucosamine mutase [Opitutaceae bacterium]|nr:phosphoglucosamine mutase [Opitutaceae bacterium]
MALRFFGTDGIRGLYGGSTLNDNIAFKAGVAAARVAKRQYGTESPSIVVGRDTRVSGSVLLAALTAGFKSEGGLVESIGVAPTPAIAKVVSLSEASMGCAITASHNPHTDNGIKFFQADGTKPSEALEQELDEAVGVADSEEGADWQPVEDAAAQKCEMYLESVRQAFPQSMLNGKRVALDCSNGALSAFATRVFETYGAKVTTVGNSPNGSNINDGVGSECPQSLAAVFELGAFDMGFAFDGDGDRMIAFDESGSKLSGEATLGLLAIHAKAQGALKRDVLVTTAQSNLGLDAALGRVGISVRRVDIGDKFVSRLMISEGFSLGGEESGHVVVGDFSMTGDGLFSALKVAQAIVESERSLGELASFYEAYPQQTRAIRVASKPALNTCVNVSAVIEKLENEFGSEGRLLVRYSGTEPKLRLLVEAKTDALTSDAIKRLEAAVATDLS